MSNRIKCALCLEHFEDPRILGCFHTFCYQCLQRYLATSLNPQRFSCPVCRSVNTLPKEGVAGLQKNFYVNEDSAKPRHPMCSSHPSEDLRFYCKTCDVAVCRDCKVISHTIHETDMIDNVTNKIKQTIEQTLIHADHTIQDSWVQARELLRREECMLNDVVTTLNRTTREIKSEADHLARVVGMRLNQNFINNRNNMTTVNNLLQMRKVSIDRYRTMLSDTLSKSNSYKVLEMYKSSFRTEEFKQLGRAPSAYEQLKEQTLSKDDIASYKEMLTKMFDNIRGKMRELQGLVPHLTRNVGTAQKTHISLCTQSCTQMKVLATVLSLSRSQQQTGTSSAVPAVGSKVPAVLVKRPAEEESSSTSQQQTATGSVVPTVSSEASSMAVKRPAEASPCPEPPKRRSQRIAKKK